MEQDEMELIVKMLRAVHDTEEQLQQLRVALNEEILFNLKDLYQSVCPTKNCLGIFELTKFLTKKQLTPIKADSLINYIRFRNHNSSFNLTFVQFSEMFLTKQNKLLAKMVLERQQMGAMPNYLLNIARNIIVKQIDLWTLLDIYSANNYQCIGKWIYSLCDNEDSWSIEQALQEFCQTNVPEINFDVLKRFIKDNNGQITHERLKLLFATKLVKLMLNDTNKTQGKQNIRHYLPRSCFRNEYYDCLNRQKQPQLFGYRQLKSLQKHQLRHCRSTDHIESPQNHSTIHHKQLIQLCKFLTSLIWLQKQSQSLRIELSLCPDFYPILFFECFYKDSRGYIIPSSMQDHLNSFAIETNINSIYMFFRRYAKLQNGKMGFNSFCNIFDVSCNEYKMVSKNRQVNNLEDIALDTKKIYLQLLTTAIKNQHKMQQKKHKLSKMNIDYKQVLKSIVTEDQGMVTLTDLQNILQHSLNIQVSKDDIYLLWHIIGQRHTTYTLSIDNLITSLFLANSPANPNPNPNPKTTTK